MAKRLICVIISVLMIVSLLPTTAFASYYTGSVPEIVEAIPVTVAEVVDEALTVDYVEDEDEVDLGDEDYGIMLMSTGDEGTETFVAKIGDTTYSTLTAAINAASKGDTIVLGSNVSETIGISSGKDVTIDLAGHTISSPSDSSTRLITMRGGKLTITDSVGGGTITSGAGDAVILIAGGTLVVEGGTISATGSIPAIVNAWQSSNYDEASTVVVNGGKVTAAGAPAIRNNAAGCSITVTGGEIVGYSGSTGYYIVDSVSDANSKSVVITGGYFTTDESSASQVLFYQKNSGNIVVSGGYFNNAISWINSAMRAAGYSNTELDTAETCNGVEYKYTVASSTVFYGTIDGNGKVTYLGGDSTPQKAINALKNVTVSDGEALYIELAADVISTVDVGTGTDTSVVLELNGYKIDAGSDAAIVVQDGVTLTVRDSEGTSEVLSSYSNGTVRNRGGVLKIEGGTYTNTTGCVLQNNGSNEATDGTYATTITGGTFTGTFSVVKGSVTAYAGITDDDGATTYYATLNKAVSAASSGDTVTVYSNVEIDEQVVVRKTVTLDLAGHTVSRGNGLAYSALIVVTSDGDLTIEDSGTNGTIDGGTVFTTSSGSTSVCIAIQIVNAGKATLTSGTLKGFYAVYAYGAGSTFEATGGNVTANEYAGNYTYGIYMAQGADVTLSGSVQVTANSETGSGCAIANFGGNSTDATTLTIKDNAVITGSTFGISTNGSASTSNWCGNTAIVMEGGTVTGTWGMYLPAVSSTTVISGGTVTGSSTGIEIRAGYLYVNGGTVNGLGDPGSYSEDGNGNGTTTVGAAIAVVQHTTKQPISVVISQTTATTLISGYYGIFEGDLQGNGESTSSVSISVTDGTITGSASAIYQAIPEGGTKSSANISVTGGTYSSDVTAYCATGIGASSSDDGKTYTIGIADGYYEVSNYKSTETYTYPSKDGKVFAGWYTDSACTTVYTATSGIAYAKFVDDDTMSIKGVVMNSVTEGDTEGTKYWRIVTGLDSLNYDAIGFEIYMGTSTEMTTISGYYWGDYTATTANRKFTASEFGTCSQYISVCLVQDTASATSCTVRAYWTTLDGTTVYGDWYTCTYTSGYEIYSELTPIKEADSND